MPIKLRRLKYQAITIFTCSTDSYHSVPCLLDLIEALKHFLHAPSTKPQSFDENQIHGGNLKARPRYAKLYTTEAYFTFLKDKSKKANTAFNTFTETAVIS